MKQCRLSESVPSVIVFEELPELSLAIAAYYLRREPVTPCISESSMSYRRKQRFVHATVGWALATVCVLVLLNALTIKRVFVFSFLGFLVIATLLTPVSITPRWKQRLRWIVVFGLLVIGYIIVRRSLRALPEGMI